MTKNIGATDRNIRIVAGIVIILLGLFGHSWLGLIGIIPLATALMGWCPAYTPLGINTCTKKESDSNA